MPVVTKNEKFCVLVLDDDICLTTIVTKALRNGLPNAEVLTARSVAEAQLLLSEFKIHFFILDINLPDGNGIDFLCDVRTLFPEARVMMITASPLPQYEQQTKELGVLLFRQKPVDTKEMVSLVRSHSEKMGHSTSVQNNDGSFAVSLTCLSALDIIQLKCLSSATLVLQVASPSGIGRIYFENGKPVHGSSAAQEGLDVLYEFVLQEEGFFRFIPEKRPAQTTIRIKLDSFILEAATLFDQTKYLKSLGLTMYSGLFSKESVSDEQELAKILDKRGVKTDDNIWQFYQALEQHPIVADAVEQAGLPLRQWTPALYKLVQSGLVNISNDRLDDEDLTQNLVTNWSYDRKAVDKLAATLYDQRSGLLRFEFLVWTIEKEVERAQTQMWPLSIMIFEFRKQGKDVSKLSAHDKELVQTTLAEISDCKRSIDWLCHFEEEQFALLMPGLDAALAAMFAKNFADICNRNLGKLREGHSEWEYSFGVSSMPGDTIEWQKMVGFACEAQRKARIARSGFAAHQDEKKPS